MLNKSCYISCVIIIIIDIIIIILEIISKVLFPIRSWQIEWTWTFSKKTREINFPAVQLLRPHFRGIDSSVRRKQPLARCDLKRRNHSEGSKSSKTSINLEEDERQPALLDHGNGINTLKSLYKNQVTKKPQLPSWFMALGYVWLTTQYWSISLSLSEYDVEGHKATGVRPHNCTPTCMPASFQFVLLIQTRHAGPLRAEIFKTSVTPFD